MVVHIQDLQRLSQLEEILNLNKVKLLAIHFLKGKVKCCLALDMPL